jgi:flagellar export protein FliJ
MRGLEALLKIRRVAEDKALEAMSAARRRFDEIGVEERALRAKADAAVESLRELERGTFGVRRSLLYRRYLNAIRSRIGRCRERAARAWAEVEEKRRDVERCRHAREAVEALIARRRERARRERAYREERALGDLAQNAWAKATAP